MTDVKLALQEKYKEAKEAEEDKKKVRAENLSEELLAKLPNIWLENISITLNLEIKQKVVFIASKSLDKLRIAELRLCYQGWTIGTKMKKSSTGPWCKR